MNEEHDDIEQLLARAGALSREHERPMPGMREDVRGRVTRHTRVGARAFATALGGIFIVALVAVSVFLALVTQRPNQVAVGIPTPSPIVASVVPSNASSPAPAPSADATPQSTPIPTLRGTPVIFTPGPGLPPEGGFYLTTDPDEAPFELVLRYAPVGGHPFPVLAVVRPGEVAAINRTTLIGAYGLLVNGVACAGTFPVTEDERTDITVALTDIGDCSVTVSRVRPYNSTPPPRQMP